MIGVLVMVPRWCVGGGTTICVSVMGLRYVCR